MPLRKAQKGIHSDNKANAAIRVFMAQFAQGLDGVRRTFLAHLTVVDHEPRLTGGREFHHLQTQLRAGQRLIPVRWIAGGQEAYFLQPQRLLQLERRTQVCVVNRIEGSAKNAHGVHLGTLPESSVACKAPAIPAARPVTAVHASPPARPLMTRSV